MARNYELPANYEKLTEQVKCRVVWLLDIEIEIVLEIEIDTEIEIEVEREIEIERTIEPL